MKTEIYTIRHGHTSFNEEKRYAGSIDVPLNDNGIKSAIAASEKLAGYKFDIVITSTKKRAIQTAELLLNKKISIIQTKLCNERNFGIMEGKTWDEVQSLEPPVLLINVGNDLHTVNPKGGEPFEDLWERAKKFRRYIFREYKGSNILIVSHGVFLQMFHGVLRGSNCIESLGFFPSNLELFRFFFFEDRLIKEEVIRLAPSDKINF